MYKIGDFSKMVSLTVKTLRYYQEIELLLPVRVDEESGYRYYDGSSFERAKKIQMLKGFHFSLTEIKEIIDDIETAEDLRAYLEEKHAQLELQIHDLRTQQEALVQAMKAKQERVRALTYHFEEKTLPDQMVASLRYRGRYDEAGLYVRQLMEAVKGAASGPVMALYHDDSYQEEDADIELCVPVKKPVAGREVTTLNLEGGRFITTRHIGGYDTLSEAYRAILDQVEDLGLEAALPSREVYLKGPGRLFKGNPDKYETEILLRV